MENDKNFLNEEKNIIKNNDLDNFFQYDYENQNIKKNKEFQNWKSKMEKKYGKIIILYKCNKDKIFFYKKKKNDYEDYINRCPKCNKYICCFCSQTIIDNNFLPRIIEQYCCLKRLFYFVFFREKFEDKEDDVIFDCILGYILFIIPFTNIFVLFLCIIQNLFCLKKTKYPEFDDYHDYYDFKNNYIYKFVKIINIGFLICMTIPYSFLALIDIFFILLISIPFKMNPTTNFIFFILENACFY